MLSDQLDAQGLRYTYASITDNLSNMKVFLGYRDRLSMFDEVKQEGRIGLPFLVVNRGEACAFDLEGLNLDDFKK